MSEAANGPLTGLVVLDLSRYGDPAIRPAAPDLDADREAILDFLKTK